MEALTWTTPGNLDTVCEGAVRRLHAFWENCPVYGVELDLLQFLPGQEMTQGAMLAFLKVNKMSILDWIACINKKLHEAGAPFDLTSNVAIGTVSMPNFVYLFPRRRGSEP